MEQRYSEYQPRYDKENPPVDIYSLEFREGVIVLAENGTLYSNQTGGTACHHPQVRGTFYPMKVPQRIKDLFRDEPSTQDMDEIDRILAKAPVTTTLCRDMGEEAWMHVLVAGMRGAIVVWENSD